LLAEGIDPTEHRKTQQRAIVERATSSFEAVAREWFSKFRPTWAATHAEKIIRRLEVDVFPWLGARPIAEITAPELLTVFRRIEARGALETAHRAHQNCGQVFRYAVATGRAERDLSGDLRGALPPTRVKHHPAITEPAEIGALLRALWSYQGSYVTRAALQLAPLLFVRPGELRNAEWSEFDLTQAVWSIPATRMKTKEAHLVPLASQAVALLQELHVLTGTGRYVFPNPRTAERPMSNNAVLSALRRMGYGKDEMTGHGFRAMARTVLDEVLGFRVDIIEHQLAHAVKYPLGACRTWLPGVESGGFAGSGSGLASKRRAQEPWEGALERPGERMEPALAGKRPPQARLRARIRLRLKARVTSVHSPATAARPRSEHCRKPMMCLMIPNTGSTVALRVA
jgi:integrase